MDKTERALEFLENEEEVKSENGDVEACEILDFIKTELLMRKAESPREEPDTFGDAYTACPNCGKSIINYYNKHVQPAYCMLCGKAVDWRVQKRDVSKKG